jgi:glycosyltransferase involved in cell wall biosynthesis
MLHVLVACHNAERYVTRCIESVRRQTVAGWRCHVIDDASTDGTHAAARAAIAGDERFVLSRNSSRIGQLANHDAIMRLAEIDDDDIAVVVDGDDWLAHEQVFEKLLDAYADGRTWITYGQFTMFDGEHYRVGFSAPPARPSRVRACRWTTAHLRTWRAHLWRRIDPGHLRLARTDRFWPMAGDQAGMLPMLELAGPARAKFLPEVSYVYNRENPGNDDKVDGLLQRKCARAIRSLAAHAPVPELAAPVESRSRPPSAAPVPTVSFCCALKTNRMTEERTTALWTTLEALAQLADDRTEVVIGDFESELTWDRARALLGDKLRVVPLRGHFNRSIGCNAASRVATGDVLFFMDADIVVTAAALDEARARVSPGRCYYPQVMYLNRGQRVPDVGDGSSLYVGTGCGVCSFHRDDFATLGGWDEDLGRNWGGEDRQLYDRAQRQLRVVRDLPRVFHQWHPTSLRYKDVFADSSEGGGVWKEYRRLIAALEGPTDPQPVSRSA